MKVSLFSTQYLIVWANWQSDGLRAEAFCTYILPEWRALFRPCPQQSCAIALKERLNVQYTTKWQKNQKPPGNSSLKGCPYLFAVLLSFGLFSGGQRKEKFAIFIFFAFHPDLPARKLNQNFTNMKP